MPSLYDLYCDHCRDMHREPPSREWWDKACSQPRHPERRLSDVEFDAVAERRGDAQ